MHNLRVIVNNLDITDFVSSAELSGDVAVFDRQLTLKINGTVDGRTRAFTFDEGARVLIYVNDALEFVGVLFAQDINNYGDITYTAFDSNIYLAKSNDMMAVINKKASDVIKMIARDFGIELGDIADTGYVIPYLMLKGTLRANIYKMLEITRKQTGISYFVGNDKGKLTLTRGNTQKHRYYIGAGTNLLSFNVTSSIEESITQVKVVGGGKDSQTVITSKDEAARVKYGVLQSLVEVDETATDAQLKEQASTLLSKNNKPHVTLEIEALGVMDVKTGSLVHFESDMSGQTGDYYVTSDKHTFTSGLHTMALTLSKTYELEQVGEGA